MQKHLFKILIAILFVGICFGQSNKKWQVIKEDSEKIIYLDTKNISEVGDQLSVWSMFVYKVMSKTDENGRRIGKVKNQYVINKSAKSFSVVGKLIYDEIGRIIKNNSNPVGPTNQVNTESYPVSSDKDVELILNKVHQFLKTGSVTDEMASTVDDMDEEKSDEDENYDEESSETEEIKPAEPVVTNPIVNTKPKENKIVFRKSKNDSEEIPSARPVNDNETPEANPSESNTGDRYDVKKEKIVRGVIFTDGNVFVVQKSAWRERHKAEKIVKALKRKGEKAFITEAKIPSKGGTWYRVRVGYFNSLSEAEKYARTHR